MAVADYANATVLTPLQIISVITFTITSVISLLAYILVLLVIFLYFKEIKVYFYFIMVSLAIPDMLYLVFILLYAVPCTVLQRDIWPWPGIKAGIVEGVCYFVECTHLAYCGLNRLLYISAPGVKHDILNKVFNTRRWIIFWIIFLWVTGIAMPVVIHVAGCGTRYNYKMMTLDYTCDTYISKRFTDHVAMADEVIAGSLVGFIVISHILTWVITWVKGRKLGSEPDSAIVMQQRKTETRLLIQFTLISFVLIAYYASFWVKPYLYDGTRAMVIMTYLGIASTAVNPFTYLVFNKILKTKAIELIKSGINSMKRLVKGDNNVISLVQQ